MSSLDAARRRSTRLGVAAALVVTGVAYAAAPVQAVVPVFEIDGPPGGANFVVNSGGIDWVSVLAGPVASDNTPRETTEFKTSSKENNAVSTWRDGNDSAPPKTDIRELYRHSRVNDSG